MVGVYIKVIDAAREALHVITSAFDEISFSIDTGDELDRLYAKTRQSILELIDYAFVEGHKALKKETDNLSEPSASEVKQIDANDLADELTRALLAQCEATRKTT